MEETLKLPDRPDVDVVLTFCDDCNPDHNPGNHFAIPEEWAEALNMVAGMLVLRGVFHGKAAAALTQGWTEEEFGHRCPVCVYEAKRLADLGDTNVSAGATDFVMKWGPEAFVDDREE